MPDHRQARRLAAILLLCFPALWGWLGLLNNVSAFDETVTGAVAPMLAMTDTYGNPAQTWRAVTAPWVAPVGLVAITAVETLAGLLSTLGILAMLRAFRAPGPDFDAAKVPGILGCLAAIAVWGLGFMVIAGDWFLSWQGKQGIMSQLGGMVYMLPASLALIVLLQPEPKA